MGVVASAGLDRLALRSLKQRVEDASRCVGGTSATLEPRFVEVQPLSPVAGRASKADTVVELSDGMTRMTIRTSSGSLVDVAQLVRAFRLLDS